MTTKEIGDMGERAACDYLCDKGYEILKRNFRSPVGEVDIIADDDGCMVFVEVKTRQNNLYGEPSEYVNYRKQQRIIKAAMCYTDTVNNDIRFDVIEVFYNKPNMTVISINHIQNAF